MPWGLSVVHARPLLVTSLWSAVISSGLRALDARALRLRVVGEKERARACLRPVSVASVRSRSGDAVGSQRRPRRLSMVPSVRPAVIAELPRARRPRPPSRCRAAVEREKTRVLAPASAPCPSPRSGPAVVMPRGLSVVRVRLPLVSPVWSAVILLSFRALDARTLRLRALPVFLRPVSAPCLPRVRRLRLVPRSLTPPVTRQVMPTAVQPHRYPPVGNPPRLLPPTTSQGGWGARVSEVLALHPSPSIHRRCSMLLRGCLNGSNGRSALESSIFNLDCDEGVQRKRVMER